MMTTRSTGLSLWLALTLTALPAASAQDGAGMQIPKPSPELKKYEPMLGTWEGSGEVFSAAGAKPMAWTAQSTAQWVLNGFFVEEKLRVSFGEGKPGLTMLNFYGFDSDAQCHMVHGVNSKGAIEVSKLTWSDQSTLIGVGTGTQDGKPFAERWVSRFAKDSYELRVDRAAGDGPFFAHVTGKLTRSKTVPASLAPDESKAIQPTSPDLKKLDGMLGTWKVKGTMIPAPGAPEMAITGTETITAILGGTVLFSHTVGDPAPGMPGNYEAFAYYTWDSGERAYDLICLSNMCEAGRMEGRFTTDGALVWTTDQRYMGTPSAARMVQTHKDGGIRFTCDRLHGAAPAVRDFTGEYTRAK